MPSVSSATVSRVTEGGKRNGDTAPAVPKLLLPTKSRTKHEEETGGEWIVS